MTTTRRTSSRPSSSRSRAPSSRICTPWTPSASMPGIGGGTGTLPRAAAGRAEARAPPPPPPPVQVDAHDLGPDADVDARGAVLVRRPGHQRVALDGVADPVRD